MTFEDAMIEAVERHGVTEDDAYDYVREIVAEAAEISREDRSSDDPGDDHPESA